MSGRSGAKFGALALLLFLFSACANSSPRKNDSDVSLKRSDSEVSPKRGESEVILPVANYPRENEAQILMDYAYYDAAMTALKLKDPEAALAFLARAGKSDNSMTETVRLGVLRVLGKNGDFSRFASQYALLPTGRATQEINCYAALAGVGRGQNSLSALTKKLAGSNEPLSEGCNTMLAGAAAQGLMASDLIWRRVKILLGVNYVTQAQNLAAAAGESLTTPTPGSKAYKMKQIMPLLSPKGRLRGDIDARLSNLHGVVDRDDIAFTKGVAGLAQARALNMPQALRFLQEADPDIFSQDTWEWYARAALRLSDWRQLNRVIASMPASLSRTPTWQYWRGRALTALGERTKAKQYYAEALSSGRNFYAVLATEELGRSVNTTSNAPQTSRALLQQLEKNGQIHRALVLFRESVAEGNQKMRLAAGNQWRFAMRGLSDTELIAAASLAAREEFYEMSIYSADLSQEWLNFSLRFPAPHRDLVDRYAGLYGVDSAWVFGLIRQESRFMTLAQSHVGAAGLMQLMPGTARLVARKIGLPPNAPYDIETNIQMGVWYLADLYNQFGSEPLATSGYNGGPGRARAWRQNGLEGAIYVETIPFNETRNYTKKVLSNTVYYSRLFGERRRSLKSRLGEL